MTLRPHTLAPDEARATRELGRRAMAGSHESETVFYAISEAIGDREWQPQALALIAEALRGAADHLHAEADALEARVRRGIEAGTICPGCGDPEGEQCCDQAPRELAA